jgi:hypothetical protein
MNTENELRDLYSREASLEKDICNVTFHHNDPTVLGMKQILESIRTQIQLVKLRISIDQLVGIPENPER